MFLVFSQHLVISHKTQMKEPSELKRESSRILQIPFLPLEDDCMCHYGKKYFIGILQALQENATITKACIINTKGEGEKGLVLIPK